MGYQKTEDRRQGAQHVVSAECAIRGMLQIVRLILSGYLIRPSVKPAYLQKTRQKIHACQLLWIYDKL